MGMLVERDLSHQELHDTDRNWIAAVAVYIKGFIDVAIAFLFVLQPGESRRLTFAQGKATS